MAEIEDTRLRSLEEAAGRVSSLEAERDAAVRALAESRARDTARPIARTVAAESDLPPGWQADLVDDALTAVPLTESGQLDETRLRADLTGRVERARTRHAEALEVAGAGTVRGNGERGQVTESGFDLDALIAARYQQTGA